MKIQGKTTPQEALLDDGARQSIRVIVKALKVCTKIRDWRAGERIHRTLVKTGDWSNIYVANTLVDMYAKCGRMSQARSVFDAIPEPNVVSWNCLLMGYAQYGQGKVTLELYDRMQQKGLVPDSVTLVSAIKACASLAGDDNVLKLELLQTGRWIHRRAVETGHELNTYVSGSLLDMYAKCCSMEDAQRVFSGIPHPDVISWTSMILGYVQCGEPEHALQYFHRMQDQGLVPDAVTFIAALKACANLAESSDELKDSCLRRGRLIHSQAGNLSITHMLLASSLVDMYSKCGSMPEARIVFDSMPQRDVVVWTAIIMGYAQSGEGEVALQLYARMLDNKWGCKPNAVTFAAALKACACCDALEVGRQVHADCVAARFVDDGLVVVSLVDFYAKCSRMEEAEQVLNTLGGFGSKYLVAAWGALVAGYSRQGNADGAFDVLERMKQKNVQPNNVILLSVLTACSHAGLVDKAKWCFGTMESKYNIVPGLEHYNCMVDVLGRRNRLDEAVDMLVKMPLEPNQVTWMTLLSACHKWKNVEVGKYAFGELLKLYSCSGSSKIPAAYVLMSSIYRSMGMQDKADELWSERPQPRRQESRSSWKDNQAMVHCFTC